MKTKVATVLAPRCRQVVVGRLDTKKEQKLFSLVWAENAQIPIEGIFPVRALTRVEWSASQPHAVRTQGSHADTGHSANACVILANFSNETLTLPKHTGLGIVEEVSKSVRTQMNPRAKSDRISQLGRRESGRKKR